MGYVIIRKDNKVIKRPELLQRIIDFGLDVLRMDQSTTEKEATHLIYQNCKINSKIFHCENQTVEFNNCKLFDCSFTLNNANLITNSDFLYCYFNVNDKHTSTTDFNNAKLKSCSLSLSGKSVNLSGIKLDKKHPEQVRKLNINADNISINDVDLFTDNQVQLTCDKLKINNSIINSSLYIQLLYNDLYMNDVYLETNGYIRFNSNSVYRDKDKPTIITDSDLKDEKKQAIYSLLSVLKGYNDQIINQNATDIKMKESRINELVSPKIESIESEISLLQKKKEAIIYSVDKEKNKIKEKCEKRKVKELKR